MATRSVSVSSFTYFDIRRRGVDAGMVIVVVDVLSHKRNFKVRASAIYRGVSVYLRTSNKRNVTGGF